MVFFCFHSVSVVGEKVLEMLKVTGGKGQRKLNKYLVGFPGRFGGRLHFNFQYSNWQQENAHNFCSFLNYFIIVFSLRIPGFAPCEESGDCEQTGLGH